MLLFAAFFSVRCNACLSHPTALRSEPVKTAQCRSSRARLGDSLTVGETTAALSSRSTEGGPVLGSDSSELMLQCVVMQRGQIKTRQESNQRPPLLDPDSTEIVRHVSSQRCIVVMGRKLWWRES